MTDPRYAFSCCSYRDMDEESREMLHQLVNAAGDQMKRRKGMSWSANVKGNATEIGEAFDKVRESAAGYGMIEAEQRDIDETRDFAMQLANDHGDMSVSASGHWNMFGADDPRTSFGQVAITIAKAQS